MATLSAGGVRFVERHLRLVPQAWLSLTAELNTNRFLFSHNPRVSFICLIFVAFPLSLSGMPHPSWYLWV